MGIKNSSKTGILEQCTILIYRRKNTSSLMKYSDVGFNKYLLKIPPGFFSLLEIFFRCCKNSIKSLSVYLIWNTFNHCQVKTYLVFLFVACYYLVGLKDKYLSNRPNWLESWKTIFNKLRKRIFFKNLDNAKQEGSPWRYLKVQLRVFQAGRRWRWHQTNRQTSRSGTETGIRNYTNKVNIM